MTEADRQQAIARLRLEDVGTEPAFDNISRLAADMFEVPIALVTVLALDRQLFRGACGLGGDGTARQVAFCDHTVRQAGVMVVEDAHNDPRFAANPLVTGEPYIRFYAGAPIQTAGGVAVGSLCLIDRKPRSFNGAAPERLQMLAATVTDLMELRAGSLLAKEREESLVTQSRLLKDTVENVNQGIAVFGSSFELVLWNALFFEQFDFPADLAREGTPASELVRIAAVRGELGPGDPDDIVAAFLSYSRTTSAGHRTIVRSNGQVLDLMRNRMSNGKFILAAADVTSERKLARTKDEFISTVNHELRTPLTAILGSLSLLKGGHAGRLEPKTERLVAMAEQNGQRLNALINDLLDIEKISTGGLELVLRRADLAAVVASAAEQNRPFADKFGIALEVAPMIGNVPVDIDEGRIQQALANLISNAVKFSPERGTVRISLATGGQTATIAVSDEGAGIPEEFQSQIFGRFAQANPADARTKGTGLGLAITKALIEQHDGRVWFSTETGKGTTFCIELPLAKE